MTANELAGAILGFAFQGKLVPQNPKDEKASLLLQRVRAEKEQLIKAGLIKKKSQASHITQEELPYEIPDNWSWARISEICELNPRNQISDDTEVSFIPMQFIEAGFLNQFRQDLSKWGSVKKGFTHLKEGDVVFAKITPCFQNRKSAVLSGLKNGYGAGTTELHVLRPFSKYISTQYLLWFVKNGTFIQDGIMNFTGTVGQQRVSTVYISQYLIPIPPLSEQKRIVAKIEELLPLIERYDESEKRLLELNKKFPDELRKSILQQAVQGKLTEQDPHDEPASELLKRIKAEKARLIKEGKIKKEKPLTPISEDEKPFEIPKSWEWVRLSQIVYNFGQKIPDEEFCYIDVGSIDNYAGRLSETNTLIKPESAPSRARKVVTRGAILYSCVRPYLLNTCIVDREFPKPPIASTAFAVLMPYEGIYNKYLHLYLRGPSFVSYTNVTSTGQAYPAINDKRLYDAVIPVPPLEEQKRIVAKIEGLLPLCDRLK